MNKKTCIDYSVKGSSPSIDTRVETAAAAMVGRDSQY